MKLILGDCLEKLKELEDNSVDAVVTDPPYELGFMGKSWDNTGIANNVDFWKECLRVLKPGGHLLSFGGTRTYHRMASAIEDAGFEVRDMIEWVYGSGFPKSLNIAKSIESKLKTGSCAKNNFHQLEGERRDGRIGMYDTVEEQGFRKNNPDQLGAFDLEATTEEAKQWEGWGTALKPAHEPICMARKPKDDKFILDACCGGRMFWFDKNHPNTLYVDKRVREAGHCKHRKNHSILPDEIVDFTMMPFSDNSFKMVVFDPPHIFGKETGNMTKQYGWLEKSNWREQIKKGFDECWRVLDDYGTLIFKWNENAVTKKEIIDLIGKTPLFGHQVGGKMQTHWMSFMKIPQEQHEEITPNHNPICMARKPLGEKNVAENCLKWGTGGINIDESRVESNEDDNLAILKKHNSFNNTMSGNIGVRKLSDDEIINAKNKQNEIINRTITLGRFPANLIHDNSEEVRECFPESGGGKAKHNSEITRKGIAQDGSSFNTETCGFDVNKCQGMANFGDSGNASRFFKSIIYTAKASKSERNKGCEELEEKELYVADNNHGNLGHFLVKKAGGEIGDKQMRKNNHPTVKPIALMEYLIKMVTPNGGIVLDPFMGSGSTGVACKKNGYDFIGIEKQPEYLKIAEARINNLKTQTNLL